MEGDRAEGIKTLPVLIGKRQAQALISAFFFLSYAMVGKTFNDPKVFVFSVTAGFLQAILINQKNYREGPVFLVYVLSLMFVLLTLHQ